MSSYFPTTDLCIPFPVWKTPNDICLPGGVCLSYVMNGIGKIPNSTDMNLDFMSQLGPAMAPLSPFFTMLETVLQIFKCLQAVPEVVTNPKKLIDCIPDLAALIDKLLGLIPQLSIPKLVKALILAIADLLQGVASDIAFIERQLKEILKQIDRAASLGDVKMNGFLVCAQQDLNDSAFSLADALKGIGRIILVINIFMGMFGGPEIPCFASLFDAEMGKGFDFVVKLLMSLSGILREIANMIPDPDIAITLALGSKKC